VTVYARTEFLVRGGERSSGRGQEKNRDTKLASRVSESAVCGGGGGIRVKQRGVGRIRSEEGHEEKNGEKGG